MRSRRHSPFALVRAHHGDECVFDGRAPGPTTPDRNGARAENLAGEGLGVDAAARCDAQGRTEVRHLVHLGPSAQRVRSFRRSLDVDFGDLEIPPYDDLLGRPRIEQRAAKDEGEPMTSLGLVHVMSREKHGGPLRRDPVDLVPEFAPAHGVDAGRGLVEKNERGLVDCRAREGDALLPTARQGPRAAAALLAETGRSQDVFDTRLTARVLDAVDTSVEPNVFLNGQVFVETEALGHVADALFDLLGLRPNIAADDAPAAAARVENAAEH